MSQGLCSVFHDFWSLALRSSGKVALCRWLEQTLNSFDFAMTAFAVSTISNFLAVFWPLRRMLSLLWLGDGFVAGQVIISWL